MTKASLLSRTKPATGAAVTLGLVAAGALALPDGAPRPQPPLPGTFVVLQGSSWPTGYSRRRAITVTTGPNPPALGYNGYTVRVTGFDTASEIAQGEMRADGNDLRVFYWDGSVWTEVPRLVTGINTADTHIIFKLQTDIAPNGTNTDHYIFYGNPAAGPPEALSYTNVYLWYDDFSTDPFAAGSARYTRAKAVDIHGQGYRAPTYDPFNQRTLFDTGDNITSDMYVDNALFSNAEQDVLITVDHFADFNYPFNATNAIVARVSTISTTSTHVYVHYSHGTYPASPAVTWNSWTNGERNTLGGTGPLTYWPFNSARTWAFAVFGTTAKFWDDGDLDPEPWFGAEPPLLIGSTTPPQSGYFGLAPSQSRGWWDNLTIRRYTEPEPTASLAAEEAINAAVSVTKSVTPTGAVTPGTDLTYTITLTSSGNADAVNTVVVDSLAAEIQFKLGSVNNSLPAGLGVVVEYSNDAGASWTYTPISGGCGAPPGYDACVTQIRWTLQGNFSPTPPNNTGSLQFVARIR